MLGCGLQPNTTLHAIEEYARPPYLFGPRLRYCLTDAGGRTFEKDYITHNFANTIQRYERAAQVLNDRQLTSGQVGNARAHLIDAGALFEQGLAYLIKDPFYFVDKVG
jgi:aminoglycoside 3-N-acetyltransferase